MDENEFNNALDKLKFELMNNKKEEIDWWRTCWDKDYFLDVVNHPEKYRI